MNKTGRIAFAMLLILLSTFSASPGLALGASLSPATVVSGPSPFQPGCEGSPQSGTVYANAEVEPWVAINPTNPDNVVGVWQQDRFSNGGARGLLTGYSANGGLTWSRTYPTFSHCTGGNAANGGDYERATDPWVSFGPTGIAYQISDSFNDSNFTNAILVSRSLDGGATWSAPATLIRDTSPNAFNDKESITADPTNPNLVYAAWDRLLFPNERARGVAYERSSGGRGPTLFSRSTDGGLTWEAPRVIVDGGQESQTIGNQIVVLPNGDLVNVFDLIYYFRNNNRVRGENVAVARSTDKGLTWSQPIIVNSLQTVGVTDPDTGQAVRTADIIPEIGVDPTSGSLYVVWQDSRFSGGAHDDIAMSTSTDGGFTWSAPMKLDQTSNNAAAFTASVHVTSDGTVGVSFYDFRNNTPDPGLLTDYWLETCSASCANPANWTETHLAGPFDMETAPDAGGFFVGDYAGLASVGNTFMPFFVLANAGGTANRTDVFVLTVTP